jgi:signal transduction histidine kinase
VQLNAVCLDSVRLLRHEARARKTDLALSLAPELPTVTGDPVQLQQVVLNLIANALDAAAVSASPRIVVATHDRGGTVEVSVSDNGRGLADNVRHRLFESFFTTKPQGLGLGLAIVKSTVERHRGKVWAENDTRGGAVFRATFPAAPGRPAVAPEAALAPAASATLAT